LFDHDAERARITDGNGKCDELAFSRPGYRIIADATVNGARATARQEYLDYITNAWRDPIPRDFFAQNVRALLIQANHVQRVLTSIDPNSARNYDDPL
jgi:hypothetical protein